MISMLAKSTSLLLAIFMLSQSFNIHLMDVLKLSNLIEHMEFHESVYGDDIFSFLAKHYGDQTEEHKGQRKDSRDHQKLPFNHAVSIDAGQLFIFDASIMKLALSDTPDVKLSIFCYYNFYSFLENTDIFQPPRIA